MKLLLIGLAAIAGFSQDAYLPLFVIERSTNANVVHYDAHLTGEGKLDPKEPVVAYWIMTARNGERERLNSLEKKTAYGFSISRDSSDDVYRMFLVSQPKREIRIRVADGVARAEMVIGGRRALLRKVFVSTGKINILHVNYLELHGVDVASGDRCYEKIAD